MAILQSAPFGKAHVVSASALVGKQIKSIDASACNIWIIECTDGTRFELETEAKVNLGAAGSIYGPTLSELR